jgi:hypothetical protein
LHHGFDRSPWSSFLSSPSRSSIENGGPPQTQARWRQWLDRIAAWFFFSCFFYIQSNRMPGDHRSPKANQRLVHSMTTTTKKTKMFLLPMGGGS